jgi:hypothetical protein
MVELCNSPDIFQAKIYELMSGLDYDWVSINDILVLTHSDWKDYIAKLDLVFNKFKKQD